MPTTVSLATRHRLLAAASQLFAERGFHGTKARDIAMRAGVNLAAANYHFGSKRELYLAVLRQQFAETRALLQRRGAVKPPAELNQLSRAEAETMLRARTQAMLDLLIGPPPGLHGTLMHREMVEPSEALPVIVAEFIQPMVDETAAIIAHLAPRLDRDTIARCVRSLMGQALFYRFAMPAMLQMMGRSAYPRGLARQLAIHITKFSLAGIDRLAAGPRRRHAR
ncbi:MAG TPA: CerR family C-terminal domain-containing protein [Candidatus Kryptonia bacterium]|nr:CerR family C-terminal domain-containing protein [Candidatus Kryptonia bacterium]